MKEMWEWKTFQIGWSVVWRALWWGGIPMAALIFWGEGRFWPVSTGPWNIVSNIVWIGGWGIMSEGIAVRGAMKKWSGRFTI